MADNPAAAKEAAFVDTPAKTQRIDYFDNLKGVLILLVVMGHVIEYSCADSQSVAIRAVFCFIYTFHMPLFIFVSGLFASKTYTKEGGFKAENVIFYLALFLIFEALISVERLCWGGTFKFNILFVEGAPWYLLAIAAFSLLTPLLYRVKPAIMLPLLVFVAIITGYLLTPETKTFLSCSRIFVYAPFFSVGYYIGAKKASELVMKVHSDKKLFVYRAAAVLFLAAFLVALFLIPEHTCRTIKKIATGLNPAYTLGSHASLYGPIRLISYVGIAAISMAVMVLVPKGKSLLSHWGERSLQIYIVHMLILYALKHFHVLTDLTAQYPLFIWSFIIVTPALTAVLAAPKFPLTWTAALKRLCCKAVGK